jgi:DNA polymerase I-like protein with 3'-5' exonuclease and polymerase domains
VARIIDTSTITPESIRTMSADERYWIYNGLDICVTEEIRQALYGHLDNTSAATYAFSRELQAPVLEMTLRGLRVNQNRRAKIIKKFEGQLARLEEQLRHLLREGVGVTQDFNWRSPTQMRVLLYDVLNLPVIRKKNSNGVMAPSTDRDALEKLTNYFIAEPIINHILGLRDLGKSLGFLRTGIDPDGRMRTNINIAGTNTGRWASAVSDYGTGTNLQNVARDLRSVFVADPGYKFGNLDLEQADARNLGALLWTTFLTEHGEEFAGRYLNLCESGDLHTQVCKMAMPHLPWGQEGKTDREVADVVFYRDQSYRDSSKKLSHGSNFVGKPPTMAKHTKFPLDFVRKFQHDYFEALPMIPMYHENVRYQLREFAYLTTLFNRRRFFFGRADDEATLREAVAFSPQSMTGEEINIGILKLWRADRVQLLMQVHDSILFQYPEEQEDEIIPWALENLRVPIDLVGGRKFVVPTEAKVGWNWADYSDDPKKEETNLDGLKKYKGHDVRTRTEKDFEFSFRGL